MSNKRQAKVRRDEGGKSKVEAQNLFWKVWRTVSRMRRCRADPEPGQRFQYHFEPRTSNCSLIAVISQVNCIQLYTLAV